MKFLLARKVEMTRLFDGERARAGTILKATPVTVTQVKTTESKDGYQAVQVAEGVKKTKNVGKALLGHTKGKGYAAIREFRGAEGELGAEIGVDTFSVGDVVRISGLTKGKGFAGVVKRYNFKGGPRTHGQKHSEREAGSIGGSGGRAGGRVAKGIRMAGRMGQARVTIENLKVLAIDPKTGEMIVSGAVPGSRGTLVEVRSVA